ncbi:MAG: GIY-YIG nuclease family protein [Alloprevotella sp.]|nr:GIY-YIG nuclease family protein [Alloprevotella sp.]
MATTDLLRNKVAETPTIYAYEHIGVPAHEGMLKVGYTTRDVETRVKEQNKTGNIPYKIMLVRPAMRKDGTSFTDKLVHRILRKDHVHNPEGEWFVCDVERVKHAIASAAQGLETMTERVYDFKMRKEQEEAVNKTAAFFKAFREDPTNKGLTPHFLWNAKMRFGKTFTTYQLALKMGWTKVLVLTFKPAVKTAWEEDLLTHKDFDGWQFCQKQEDREFSYVNERKPFVCFASFQDVLGKNAVGGIKATNEWIQTVEWDCIVLDEYHYGAWGKNAKSFYDKKDIALRKAEEMSEIISEDATNAKEVEARELYDEELMPLRTGAYLYLSGTPFRAISTGEFIEEQIYNWTYSDEQAAKEAWQGEYNPYAQLPKMVMLTYQLPDSIREIASQGEFDEFDLNEFFRAEDDDFVHEEYVQKWLELIRGSYVEDIVKDLKLGVEKPPMPFSDSRLLSYLQHTYWFLPSVAACRAMAKLLRKRSNRFFDDYEVIVAAGNDAGMGARAIEPVYEKMADPQKTKTITLSCGKLSTGVTVKPWTGILMLRNTTSPETYFQAAFRVQSPWTTKDEEGNEVILKPLCYVFDFAPNRALRLVQEYSCNLNVTESNPEKKVEEFIKFLPILAFDGSSMKEINAAGVLDMAMSGTTATLLARRWESAVLVNVDNATLQRLLDSPEAMTALMNIEGFRSLNADIETIINKSEHVKKVKKEKGDNITPKEKKELTAEEREFKSKRKEIQEKLIKFATRIPVFMYLTDFREYCLKDVIMQLEPELFRKVTGLTLKDFTLLVSLGVFNSELMNDAVYKFKRYEDSSLEYTGIDKHTGTVIGLWDTTIDTAETKTEEEPQEEIKEEPQVEAQSGPTVKTTDTATEPKRETKPAEANTWQDVAEGDYVNHKSFGKGKVISLNENFIVVKFHILEKKFVYPMVFERGYMSYCPPKKTSDAEQTVRKSESPLTVEDIKRIDKEVKKFLADLKLDGSSKKTSLSGAFSELKSKRFWRDRAAAAFKKVGIESRDQLTLPGLKELIPKNVQVDKETGKKIIGVWEERRQKDANGNYILNEDGTYKTEPNFKVCKTWSLELLIKILAENGIEM